MYIYAGKNRAKKIHAYDSLDLILEAESGRQNFVIMGIVEDNEFLYMIATSERPGELKYYKDSRIWKIQKSNMSNVTEIIVIAVEFWSISIDDDYVYVGTNVGWIYKYSKETLVRIGNVTFYPGLVFTLVNDEDYLYYGGYPVYNPKYGEEDLRPSPLMKYRKDGSAVAIQSESYYPAIYCIHLDGDYIYIGGGTYMTYARYPGTRHYAQVWKLNRNTLEKLAVSEPYGLSIYDIASDTDFLYVVGEINRYTKHQPWYYFGRSFDVPESTTSKIFQYSKVTLEKIDESDDYGGTITQICKSENSLYIGGLVNGKVWRVSKAQLTKVGQSPQYYGITYGLAISLDYIFTTGETAIIWKIDKDDMSLALESDPLNSEMDCLVQDLGYIYTDGEKGILKKLDQQGLSVLAESDSYGDEVRGLCVDSDYVYRGGIGVDPTVRKHQKSDLKEIAHSEVMPGDIWGLACDDDYVFMLPFTANHRIHKLDKSDLSIVGVSDQMLGNAYNICVDESYIYVVCGYPSMIYKLLKSDMSILIERDDYPTAVIGLCQDAEFIYVGGPTSGKIWQLRKSTFEKVAESEDLDDVIGRIVWGFNFLYCCGVSGYVHKISKYALRKICESTSIGGDIYTMSPKVLTS